MGFRLSRVPARAYGGVGGSSRVDSRELHKDEHQLHRPGSESTPRREPQVQVGVVPCGLRLGSDCTASGGLSWTRWTAVEPHLGMAR